MIGDYTASELSKWKKLYRETGEVTGPRELETNIPFRKQFIAFFERRGVPLTGSFASACEAGIHGGINRSIVNILLTYFYSFHKKL